MQRWNQLARLQRVVIIMIAVVLIVALIYYLNNAEPAERSPSVPLFPSPTHLPHQQVQVSRYSYCKYN